MRQRMLKRIRSFYSSLKVLYSPDEMSLLMRFYEKIGPISQVDERHKDDMRRKLLPTPLITGDNPGRKIHKYTGRIKSGVIIALHLPVSIIATALYIIFVTGVLVDKSIPILGKLVRLVTEIINTIGEACLLLPCLLICGLTGATIVNTFSYAEAYTTHFFCGGYLGEEPGYKKIVDSMRFCLSHLPIINKVLIKESTKIQPIAGEEQEAPEHPQNPIFVEGQREGLDFRDLIIEEDEISEGRSLDS